MKIETTIVGMQFHPGAFAKLEEDKPVGLLRQPDNPADSNAIACEIDGVLVGYIPRDDAVVIARHMDEGQTVHAIRDGYSGLTVKIAVPEEVE